MEVPPTSPEVTARMHKVTPAIGKVTPGVKSYPAGPTITPHVKNVIPEMKIDSPIDPLATLVHFFPTLCRYHNNWYLFLFGGHSAETQTSHAFIHPSSNVLLHCRPPDLAAQDEVSRLVASVCPKDADVTLQEYPSAPR